MRESAKLVHEPRNAILAATISVRRYGIVVSTAQIVAQAERHVTLISVSFRSRAPFGILPLPLFEKTLQIRVHHEGESLLSVVIAERQPFVVLVRKNDGTVVHSAAVDAVGGQLVARIEIV
jgi:hypothetical protein